MDAIKMLFGWVHVILALLVAIQIVAGPIYGGDAADTIWEILEWLMLIGVIAAVIFNYLRVSDDGSDEGAKRSLWAAVILALLFWDQWFNVVFNDASGSARDLLGVIIPVFFVAVSARIGLRLLSSSD